MSVRETYFYNFQLLCVKKNPHQYRKKGMGKLHLMEDMIWILPTETVFWSENYR